MDRIHGLVLVWGNELVLVGVLVVAYLTIRLARGFQSVCFMAVVSASCALFNPYVAHTLLGFLRVFTFWRFYFPTSYVIPAIAVVAGHFALRHIRRSATPLRGKSLAWLGLCVGYAWLAGTLGYYLLYAFGVSG